MSKKIIYLLSLLMALSLVFASCKKNGDISGPGPGTGYDESPETTTGLADSQEWLDQNSDKPIKNQEIPNFQTTGGVAYFRNPVIVVMGAEGKDVVIFAEKRYDYEGTANDIGINGDTATDIVYISSQDAGKNWGTPQIAGRIDQSTGGSDAVASPVVFKVAENKVVVVASAGAGLSRVDSDYQTRITKGESQKSQLQYAVGTYNKGTFSWDKTWTDITQIVNDAINSASDKFSTPNSKQFATHSGRGAVDASGNMYLAVTVSDQGVNSTSKELMGNIIFKGDNPNSGNTVNWTVISGSAVKFADVTGNFSTHKESRVIAASGSSLDQIEYIAVGSPWSNPKNEKIGYAKASSDVVNTIDGSEGSPSYLEVKDWRGSQSYNPKEYSLTSGTPQRLFAHVITRNKNITMYALGTTGFSSTGKPYTVEGHPEITSTLAKSSSMDVLGDGTIVMVAEQAGTEKQYKVLFKRFTQKFLATQLNIQ